VGQCAIANELDARTPECIGVDLVECPGQVTVAYVHPWAREREGRRQEAQQHVTGSLRHAFTVMGRSRERIRVVLAELCRVRHPCDCVEAADAARVVLVRDTKDRDGGTLAFSVQAWKAFAAMIKNGETA
jgi:hypothetical protein